MIQSWPLLRGCFVTKHSFEIWEPTCMADYITAGLFQVVLHFHFYLWSS